MKYQHFNASMLLHFVCALAPLREIFLLLTFVAVLQVAARAENENWDRFRGPNGAGQSDATGIPSEWTPKNFLWRQPLPGVGHSSPVVWGDRLFVMSGDPATGQQILLAIDALSGAPLWQKRFDSATYSMHQFNSYASSTPAVDDSQVYAMWLDDGRIKLAAVTHDGEQVWSCDAGPFGEKHGFGKSPIVVDDLVIVATDSEAESEVIAFDSSNGKVRWRVPRPSCKAAFASPCLLDPSADQKLLLTLSTTAGLAAMDVATGRIIWQGLSEAVPERCVSSPIVAGGLVFISSGVGGNGKFLVAARPGDEKSGPTEAYRMQQSVPNVPTPVVAGDLLFVWHDRGYVSCYDVSTGKRHFLERVGGNFHSSPVRIGDRIFCASREGEMVVLAADHKFKVLARNTLDEPCHATPAVAHNRLYVRTESTLLCIGEAQSK
jgi:outer membrane protein assembly factor BamB